MEKRRPKPPFWIFIIFPLGLLLLYFPVIYMVIFSFFEKQGAELVLSFRWYREVFEDNQFQNAAIHSLRLATLTGILSSVLGLVAAIAVGKTQFFGKKILGLFSLISLLLPELVIGLSLLVWFHILGLQLGFSTVLIAHITFTLTFCFYTMSSRMSEIDGSLVEAAADLGAFDGRILRQVLIPLMAPAIASSFVLGFMLSFDDFLITFFVNGVGMDTLPVKLYSTLRTGHSPKVNALASLLIFFTLFSIWISTKYFKLQKYIKG